VLAKGGLELIARDPLSVHGPLKHDAIGHDEHGLADQCPFDLR